MSERTKPQTEAQIVDACLDGWIADWAMLDVVCWARGLQLERLGKRAMKLAQKVEREGVPAADAPGCVIVFRGVRYAVSSVSYWAGVDA